VPRQQHGTRRVRTHPCDFYDSAARQRGSGCVLNVGQAMRNRSHEP
jgi:hypothetical protein